MTPYFDNFAAAMTMDGHGGYVWSAYIIVIVAIVLLLILPRIKERKVIARILGELKRQESQVDPAVRKQ
ncbi:MAG: heme exporter protein CcmD [Halioglobus sp.]